jgi:hypothetical protein
MGSHGWVAAEAQQNNGLAATYRMVGDVAARRNGAPTAPDSYRRRPDRELLIRREGSARAVLGAVIEAAGTWTGRWRRFEASALDFSPAGRRGRWSVRRWVGRRGKFQR